MLYAADHGLAPWCDLLKTIREGGRGSERLLDYESAQACYEKIRAGEMPPLLPCETAAKGQNRGVGVSLVPQRSLALYARRHSLVRLPWPKRFVRELVVVVRRQRKTPEHIQRFVENILF